MIDRGEEPTQYITGSGDEIWLDFSQQPSWKDVQTESTAEPTSETAPTKPTARRPTKSLRLPTRPVVSSKQNREIPTEGSSPTKKPDFW